jgi:hypothetical protein
MLEILQIITVLLVAIAMALSLAHALEFPGKLRLSREQYLTVQPIYYPGFTIGGAAEPLAISMTALLLFLVPAGSTAFWLTVAGLAALVIMHAAYWLLVHPVNNFWLKDFKLKGMGQGFFGFDPLGRTEGSAQPEWTQLRDRWEYSHIIRAVLGLAGLTLLVSALAD